MRMTFTNRIFAVMFVAWAALSLGCREKSQAVGESVGAPSKPDSASAVEEPRRALISRTAADSFPDSTWAVNKARRALVSRTHSDSFAVYRFERSDSSVFVELVLYFPAGSPKGAAGGGGRVEVLMNGSTRVVSLFR